MDYKKLAELLYPDIDKTIEDYEKKYPERNLPEGAEVVRFAPSPTGRIHLGNLFAAFTPEVFARQSNGVFILRIEDTDDKRAIENGIELIYNDLKDYEYKIDENPIDGGEYGPYIQSERKDIYSCFAKHLVSIGRAYPCFCSEEEISFIREKQEKRKARVGYYGRYARCRNLSLEEIETKLKDKKPYTIRLKSLGDFNKKIIHKDRVKGTITIPDNDIDHILVKSDGIPPYAFAHVVDDYLMKTTTVTRDDWYVSSLPYHLEIWHAFGFKPPKYAHLLPINVKEGDTIRKISKRKDPEAAISFYHEKGVPKEAIKLYFATLLNSNFEGWYLQNKDKDYAEFEFTFEKMSKTGPLFDIEKLINISKNFLSELDAKEMYYRLWNWSKEFDSEFNELIDKYKEYTIDILNIERSGNKPRKDFAFYSEIKDSIWYMYDELYLNDMVNNKDVNYDIVNSYIDKYYNIDDDKQTWFDKIKKLAEEFGYASDMNQYKENPNNFKGSIADLSNMIRVAITSKSQTPDLYEIMKLLGTERIKERINN